MFLKELQEESQKTLFLELTALIMMAEGDKQTTSKQIKKVKIDNKSSAFFQSIDENEIHVLNAYAEELGILRIDRLFLESDTADSAIAVASAINSRLPMLKGTNLHNLAIETAIKKRQFQLISVLKEQTDLAFSEYSQLENFKKEVMLNLISSGVDVLNINPKLIEEAMLTTSALKQDILRRTAKELISIKKDILGKLEGKEKKIILFELIGAGYSSGHFGDEEKSLLLYICELLHIESEYIEEFLEISERLFAINKDLTILINE